MSFNRILPFILIGVLLVVLSYHYGGAILKILIPMYQWAIQQFEYRFDHVLLAMQQVKGANYLLINVSLSHAFYANGELLEPVQAIYNTAGMPLGNVMHPLVMILTIVFAWPASQWIVYAYRTFLAMPFILIIMLLDMPIQLIYASWQGLDRTLNLSIANTSWYGFWSDFLNGGGLIALSIACGLVIISLTDYLVGLQNVPDYIEQPRV
ncbi:MAG TPA: hypothetical protein DCO68_10890 [Methylophilaceae bacterium]|nr:hypothetical protein [Methylophilaceae bacterium]HAJ72572.1 hypothetical protein [Methylophilaceae bacterium]